MNKHLLLQFGFAAVLGAQAAAGVAAPAVPPAVVLVHGAWMGASSWDKVAAKLRAQGLKVTAVELPGHGRDITPPDQLSLALYVDAVLAALPEGAPAVLVGHSMAGMVISAAAEKAPSRIAKLGYVAAYLPQDGQSLYQLSQTDADSQVPKFWRQQDPAAYTPAWIASEGIVPVFCADCSAADQVMLKSSHKAEAIAPLGTPVKLSAAAFGSVPKVYVHTLRDQAVSLSLQRAMVAAAGDGVQVTQLDTGHAPMLSRPKELAELIARAALPAR
jgi:pimeloyl-ACP methyl ester carboxylesterase